MSNSDCGKLLCILGGVLILIEGLLLILGGIGIMVNFSFPTSGYFGVALGAFSSLIWGIIELIVGILILGESGVGKRRRSNAAVMLLILGIIAIILFNLLGGLLVLIGAIILLL